MSAADALFGDEALVGECFEGALDGADGCQVVVGECFGADGSSVFTQVFGDFVLCGEGEVGGPWIVIYGGGWGFWGFGIEG